MYIGASPCNLNVWARTSATRDLSVMAHSLARAPYAQDSLGGSCKTVMVVAVSPSQDQFEETLNTLKYAKPLSYCDLRVFTLRSYRLGDLFHYDFISRRGDFAPSGTRTARRRS